MSKEILKEGDVVKLKGGVKSPEMVIADFRGTDFSEALCVWFSESFYHEAYILCDVLEKK